MKYIVFLLSLLFLASCTKTQPKETFSEKESFEITTIEIQNSIVDSCTTLAYVNDNWYQLDSLGLVTRRFYNGNRDEIKMVAGVLFLTMAAGILFGLMIGVVIDV